MDDSLSTPSEPAARSRGGRRPHSVSSSAWRWTARRGTSRPAGGCTPMRSGDPGNGLEAGDRGFRGQYLRSQVTVMVAVMQE